MSSPFVVLTPYRARMASSVARLFASAGLAWHSFTPWGTLPRLSAPGLYAVSTSADPSAVDAPSTRRLSDARIDDLLTARPEMMVGGLPADARRLAEALLAMWPEGETVLYIGLAGTSVSYRVGQYYATPLGARAPHAGGWPIKMHADLASLFVHVARAEEPEVAEVTVLRAFMAGVDPASAAALSDPSMPLPFANLELTKGTRKRHQIRGAKARRVAGKPTVQAAPVRVLASPAVASTGGSYSLNVTAADLAAGHVRVTSSPKHALALPRVKARLVVNLRDKVLTVGWDPRIGADRERSGLLHFGKAQLLGLLKGPATLMIDKDDDGVLRLR